MRLHEDVILIDQFGMETCDKPNNQEDEAVFSYHYELADTMEALNKVASRLTARDSLFLIDSLSLELMKARKFHKAPGDSTLWEEYRVLHSMNNKKLTVLFRIQEVNDTINRDIWYHKQAMCHNIDN